jgi:hypothetical protein
MPSLRDLVNNLSSFNYYTGIGNFTQNKIPFGDDNLNGDSSNQPYVVTPPGFRWSPSNIDDGFLQFGAATVTTRTAADVLRISKFLTTLPKGPLFLLKQVGLQRSGPLLQYYDVTKSTKTAPFDTRAYNPLGATMLAQIAGNGIGARYLRHGMVPRQSDTTLYENTVREADREDPAKGNRLSFLSNVLTDIGSKQFRESFILKYPGGSDSFFGIGETTIKRYYNTMVDVAYNTNDNGFIKMPIRDILSFKNGTDTTAIEPNQNTLGVEIDPDQKIDFRVYKNQLLSYIGGGVQLATTDYKTYNLEDRIGISKNRPAEDRYDYKSDSNSTQDKVNNISLYYSNGPSGDGTIKDFNGKIVPGSTDKNQSDIGIRDLIKFRIKILDNNAPTKGVYIIFRAYISDVKRSVTSKWNEYGYVGRGEQFFMYDGFSENITLTFTIAASSRTEMKPLYQKLNYLISSMAPEYSSKNNMKGNIAELTVGNFIIYQPGIITNFNMDVPNDVSWEIAIDEPEQQKDSDMQELPHMLKCSMVFRPVYNFLPQKSSQSPFIGIDLYQNIKPGQKWLTSGYSSLVTKY